MAKLTKINETDAGNFVGYISVQETRSFQGMNVEIDEMYFVRLADDKMKLGEIKGFDLDAWIVEESTDDNGNTFKWLKVG
tara:strand:+ start:894 stop:1133 length:240 start_codon:yes stop_codon:yes gene_type:complete